MGIIAAPKSQHLAHFRNPRLLEDGTEGVFEAKGCVYLAVKALAGATVTLSRVDGLDATEHDSEEETVAAGTRETFEVDWPLWYVSVSGGNAVIALG